MPIDPNDWFSGARANSPNPAWYDRFGRHTIAGRIYQNAYPAYDPFVPAQLLIPNYQNAPVYYPRPNFSPPFRFAGGPMTRSAHAGMTPTARSMRAARAAGLTVRCGKCNCSIPQWDCDCADEHPSSPPPYQPPPYQPPPQSLPPIVQGKTPPTYSPPVYTKPPYSPPYYSPPVYSQPPQSSPPPYQQPPVYSQPPTQSPPPYTTYPTGPQVTSPTPIYGQPPRFPSTYNSTPIR